LQSPEARRVAAWDGHRAAQAWHDLHAYHLRRILDRSLPTGQLFTQRHVSTQEIVSRVALQRDRVQHIEKDQNMYKTMKIVKIDRNQQTNISPLQPDEVSGAKIRTEIRTCNT
jgi:hypothetical protein